jgi:hypothetical protein
MSFLLSNFLSKQACVACPDRDLGRDLELTTSGKSNVYIIYEKEKILELTCVVYRTTILPQPEKLQIMLDKFRSFQESFLKEYQ